MISSEYYSPDEDGHMLTLDSWVRSLTDLPIIVKGVQCVEVSSRCSVYAPMLTFA